MLLKVLKKTEQIRNEKKFSDSQDINQQVLHIGG
jgi:hypothetical protein